MLTVPSDIWTTITFANKPEIMAEVLKISEAARVPLTNVADFRWNNLFQPIPKYYSKLSQERGGNVLGIERAEGDSICKCAFWVALSLSLFSLNPWTTTTTS